MILSPTGITITTILTLLSTALFTTTTTAYVIPVHPSTTNPLRKRDASNALNQLLTIVPSASSCANAPSASECVTASTALNPILDSFTRHSITTAPEQAALLSWMAYESAEFKYNINHYPGTPGQGTRVMLMPNFVAKYIASMPEMNGEASGKDVTGLLALVLDNEHSFDSAAWFYSTQCSESVKQGVRTGGRNGWEAFVSGCVGTTVDEGSGSSSRVAYWQRACQALGVSV